MCRKTRARLFLGVLVGVFAAERAWSGSITGRREGQFGDGVHESLIWAVGAGDNSTTAHGIALSWLGNYTISDLPAGQYYLAGNAHGAAPHVILDLPITVPGSGSVEMNLYDRITMGSQGLTDLDACQWAAQTFIATGRDLDEVVVITPDGGTQVSISVRQGGPEGPQIGPARTVNNADLFPAGARWAPGEVPLIPGRQYAVRVDLVSGASWAPAVAYRARGYPNGHAWLDGEPIPEADLKVSIACRDTGFFQDYSVSNWWRSNTFAELIQTFVPQGQELRIAQMMLAGEGGYLMRASVHEWNGSYPPGAQVGFAKHANMSKDLPQAFVWGPGEASLTPGQQYAIRFVRTNGQDFAIYGDSDKYSQGQAYFDGVPDGGIDIHGTLVTKEIDRGEIALSSLTFTPISGTEIRATFQTDVAATATIAYRTGSPPFDTVWPADEVERLSHDIIVRHLEPNTAYDMWVLAYNATRNVLSTEASATQLTTPNEFAAFTGHIDSQDVPVAGVEMILEQPGLTTLTDALGAFAFPSAPTGRHTLRAQAVAYGSLTQEVDVTADGLGFADLTMIAYTNLLAGTDDNPLAGWTMFGDFDGEYNSGDWSIQARTGPKWVGYVANWPDMSPGEHGGGIYRTMTVEQGQAYRFGGFIQTRAFGSDHDPIDGLAVARIGVDPTGGTDPAGSSVIWARMRFTSGAWMEQTVDFTAQAAQATLFAHHKWEYFYETPVWYIAAFDDLWLGRQIDSNAPQIDRDPSVLSTSTAEGQIPPDQYFTVGNSGGGTLEYTITDNRTWMWVVPDQGTSTGEADTITVRYDTASLAPGQYAGTITVSDPDATNHPQYIQVNLAVQEQLLVQPEPGTLIFQDGRKYPDETAYAGTKDAHILQEHSLYNTGGNDVLEAARFDGGSSTHDRSVVIKFTELDTSLEAGKYLQEATVTLNYSGSRNDPGGVAKTLSIHKLLHDWGEGTKTGIDGAWAGAGEVCWTKPYGATGGDNPNWNGTLDAQYADPAALDSATLSSGGYGPLSFNVTAAVAEHLANPSQNFGFVIREQEGGESTEDGTRQFRSREYALIGNRPSLTLTFVDQPPAVNIESVRTLADHGGPGQLELSVNLTAATLPEDSPLVTTESRDTGISKLVIDCDGDVTLPSPAEDAVESIIGEFNGNVTANVVSVTAVADVLTINLTALPDQDTYTVTLSGSVIAGDRDFMIRALQGEVDNAGASSQVVNALDLSSVRMNFSADVTVGDNAKYDIVSDGVINALDLSQCRMMFTHTAP